jgi:hypothetical protein
MFLNMERENPKTVLMEDIEVEVLKLKEKRFLAEQ